MQQNPNRFKFRVYNTKDKKWIHGPNGGEVHLFGEHILLGGFMKGTNLDDLNNCVVLQNTGFFDKDGTPVYDGDILTFEDGTFESLVFWDDNRGSFRSSNKLQWFVNVDQGYLKHFIVTGNQFDNPELIQAHEQ